MTLFPRTPVPRSGGVILLLLLVSLAFGGGAVWADDDHERARWLRDTETILSLEEVLDTAYKAKSGRLLEVYLKREHGRYVYEVEILTPDGVVWEMLLDARTGEMVQIEGERDDYDDDGDDD